MTIDDQIAPGLRDWLTTATQLEASDLHVVADYPPMLRIHGELKPINEQQKLEPARMGELLLSCCNDELQQRFHQNKNIDFSFNLSVGEQQRRFRVNFFLSGGRTLGACFRLIPYSIPSLDWAQFPAEIADRVAHFRNGLVLLSGVAGSGKTTTLAMLIDMLNKEGGYRIITVEEPIEYLFPRTTASVVTQREVGTDVDSFADGLKYGLRQDPDVMLVGEIRDRETAQMALSAAETGHLVFSTLHTRDAKGAVSRYADLFPQTVQSDIRSQLAMSLRAVISQHLVPSADPGGKQELALEIMFNSSPIASAIRTGKVESIDNSILTGRSMGMITLNESIKQMLATGRITREVAMRYCSDVAMLK